MPQAVRCQWLTNDYIFPILLQLPLYIDSFYNIASGKNLCFSKVIIQTRKLPSSRMQCQLILQPYINLGIDLLPPSNLKRNAVVSYETLPLFYEKIFSHIEVNHNLHGQPFWNVKNNDLRYLYHIDSTNLNIYFVISLQYTNQIFTDLRCGLLAHTGAVD